MNFNTVTGRDLLVNNLAGQIAAANGSISFRDPSYFAKEVTRVMGGTLSAETVDLFGGDGLVKVDAEEIAGMVNVSGGMAHIYASSGTLNIGKMELTGDPTIANSNGDVVLNSNLVFDGDDLAILASGNVRATSGITLIDLHKSTSAGSGGSLNILAGYNFTPATTGQTEPPDTSTTYTITGPSASGGAVQLQNVAIDTSTIFSSPHVGGSVTITASDGDVNAGTVSVGSVDTRGSNNQGGSISIFGQSGVFVNGNLVSNGRTGGSITINGAQRLVPVGGTVTFLNGTKGGTGSLAPEAIAPTRATAVVINGAVSSVGSSNAGGAVTLSAETLVQVNGSIISQGTLSGSGGNITINSAASFNKPMITVTGDLIANAVGASFTNPALVGPGGDVVLEGGTVNTIGGSIITSGGNALALNTQGGSGGDITITTIVNNLGTSPEPGNVGSFVVNGFLNTSGGHNDVAPGGTGGAGGAVVVNVGTLRVLGTIFSFTFGSASIFAAGGDSFGLAPNGPAGTVTVTTKGFQPLPTNFNPLSTQATELALPGGMFSVGNAAVNGTVSDIKNGDGTLNSSNASRVVNQTVSQGTTVLVSITTSISSASIDQNGVPTPISVDGGSLGSPRTLVTPGQALALYQLTRDNALDAQTVGLNALGQVTSINPATTSSPSVFKTGSREQLLPFTAFVVAAVDSASQFRVEFQGSAPIVDLRNVLAPTISGSLVFPTPSAQPFIDLGQNALTIPSGATIQNNDGTSSSLLIAGGGKAWTILGSLLVHELRIEHPVGTAFSLSIKAPNGTLQMDFASGKGVIMHVPGQALTLALRDPGNIIDTVDGYEELKVPVAFFDLFQTSQSATAPVGDPTKVTVTLSASASTLLAGSFTTGGAVSITSKGAFPLALGNVIRPLVVNATTGITIKSKNDLSVGDDSTFTTQGKLTAQAKGQVLIGADSNLTAAGALTLKAASTIQVNDGTTVESTADKVAIAGPTTVLFGAGTTLSSGLASIAIKSTGDVSFGNASDVSAQTTLKISTADDVDFDNATIEADKLTISGGNVFFRSGSAVQTLSGISIKATREINLTGSVFEAATGLISLTTPFAIQVSDVTMTAGVLSSSAPTTGVLDPSDILSKGSIVMTAGLMNVFSFDGSTKITTVGGDLRLTVKSSNLISSGVALQLPNIHNHFPELRADGGNIFLFCVTGISVGTNTNFIARAVGANGVGKGGGVELGAGITSSGNLAKALKGPADPNQPSLGSNVTFINPNGVVRKLGPDVVDLSVTTGTTLRLDRGALVFGAFNGHTVLVDGGGEFSVAGFVPIKYEGEEDRGCEDSPSGQLISFMAPAGPDMADQSGLFDSSAVSGGLPAPAAPIPADTLKSDGGLQISKTPDGAWQLMSGSALLRATGTLRLRASGAQVAVRKGALVSLEADNGALRVRVLSGPGHVAVVAAGKTIRLGPGQEAYLADHVPGDDDAHCRDNVGRREVRKYQLADGCTMSLCDFSIISLLASKHHLKDLARSESMELRRIFGRLVKTAAAVDQLTATRGRYVAKPVVGTQQGPYHAVSYQR